MNEALKVIDEEGIDSLIGSPPSTIEHNANQDGLSDEELEELDDFLIDATLEQTSMDIATLNGYLRNSITQPIFRVPNKASLQFIVAQKLAVIRPVPAAVEKNLKSVVDTWIKSAMRQGSVIVTVSVG